MKCLTFPAGVLGDREVRVALIGSCRLLGPFDRSSFLDFFITGYTHTLSEGIQKYKWMASKLSLPTEVSPYIFDQQQPKQNSEWSEFCNNLDIVLFEISSLQEICYENYKFQLNYFYRNFVSHYGSSLSNWYRNLSLCKEITAEDLDEIKSHFVNLSQIEINFVTNILLKTHLRTTNSLDLIALFEENRPLFPARAKFGFVTHFLFNSGVAPLLQARAKLINEVKNAAEVLRIDVYDPSNFILKHDSEIVLAKNGKDVNHYSQDFYPNIYAEYQNFLKNLLIKLG
jgi:hypothetical protein